MIGVPSFRRDFGQVLSAGINVSELTRDADTFSKAKQSSQQAGKQHSTSSAPSDNSSVAFFAAGSLTEQAESPAWQQVSSSARVL
jgi:hypothetical protein